MKTIPKQKSYAFGKYIYLIGRDKDGNLLWLEAPSWDCGWYWGFGYVETYTRQEAPATSRDINSHTHWNSLLGKQNDGSYSYHINEILRESTLTNAESWELADLMKSFYTLNASAAVLYKGNSNVASNLALSLKDTALATKINKDLLPKIFARVREILTPSATAC